MHDLVTLRTQMGEAVVSMMSVDGAVTEMRPESWMGLSGLPSVDWNLALIHGDQRAELTYVLGHVEAVGCPALLMFAGAARGLASELPGQWKAVGSTPIMTVDLAVTPTAADPRVREGRPNDIATISRLVADAYGLEFEHVELLFSANLGNDAVKFWLLEDDGEAVSTVMAVRTQDTVSLWCMATPARLGRRGYGRSLLAATLEWAKRAGATKGVLGATPAGEPLYRATGWEVVESWDNYVNADSVQFGH